MSDDDDCNAATVMKSAPGKREDRKNHINAWRRKTKNNPERERCFQQGVTLTTPFFTLQAKNIPAIPLAERKREAMMTSRQSGRASTFQKRRERRSQALTSIHLQQRAVCVLECVSVFNGSLHPSSGEFKRCAVVTCSLTLLY